MRRARNWRVRYYSDARCPGRLRQSRRHGRRNSARVTRRARGWYFCTFSTLAASNAAKKFSNGTATSTTTPVIDGSGVTTMSGRRIARYPPAPWTRWFNRTSPGSLEAAASLSHCIVTQLTSGRKRAAVASGEGFPTHIRIADSVGHRRPIDAPHLRGVRRDAHGAQSPNHRSECTFLTA